MSKNDYFASKEARDLHNYMLQGQQLRSIAKSSISILAPYIHGAIQEAAESIEKLAIGPPINTDKYKPTESELESACLRFRHDYGLLSDDERKKVKNEALAWFDAWSTLNN